MRKTVCLLPCLFAGLMLIISHAKANTTLEKIQHTMAKPEMLCGKFNQKKILSGFKSALNSDGRFCVHANKGIIWQTLKPFPNTLHLTKNEITQWQGDRVIMRMDAQREPAIQMINNVLFSLIAGDFSQLEKLFQAESRIKDNKWHVALKAKDRGLSKAIERISLNGDAYVRDISINEASGDKTHIVFSDIQIDNATKIWGEIFVHQ